MKSHVLRARSRTEPTMRFVRSISPFYLRIDESYADNKRKASEEEKERERERCWGDVVEKKGKKERQTSRSGQTFWTEPSARDFCKRRDELALDDYFVDLRDWIRVGGCLRVRPGPSFENESPSARLFIRYDLLAPTATATPGTRCHEPVRCCRQRSLVPSVPAYPPRKFTATPEEALYLTANNRTIFHVTAFARLATSIRRVCPQLS